MSVEAEMTGKVAVITGAGSGIGRQAAIALGKQGWHLVLAGRRLDALEETARQGAFVQDRVLIVPTDVSDPVAVDALFANAVSTFGHVDLLFNNAGIFHSGPIEDIAAADWERSVAVNLSGAFYCAQSAFRQMKLQNPQGGRIINNGSISAHAPRPLATPYTVTKHAITGLTNRSLWKGGRTISLAGRSILEMRQRR